MSIKVNNMSKYGLQMEKPDKDIGFVHTIDFKIYSSNSYFDPITISMVPDSETYNQIFNRVKYIK